MAENSDLCYSAPVNGRLQGGPSVVVYSNCQCSSAFCLSLTYCSIYLG